MDKGFPGTGGSTCRLSSASDEVCLACATESHSGRGVYFRADGRRLSMETLTAFVDAPSGQTPSYSASSCFFYRAVCLVLTIDQDSCGSRAGHEGPACGTAPRQAGREMPRTG